MVAPLFTQTLVETLKLAYKERGLFAFVPIKFGLLIGFPLCVLEFFVTDLIDVSLLKQNIVLFPLYAAFIAVAGFCAASSISTMAQIFNLTQDAHFADYLSERKVLDSFIFWPQFNLVVQYAFILFTLFCIGQFAVRPNAWSIRLLALDVGALLYSLEKTWNLIDLVRQLAWYRSDYIISRERLKREGEG